MKKIVVLLCLIAMQFSLATARDASAVYIADDGIKITSYAENWQKDKLEEIYKELKKNIHGEEWNYLESVNLYPGPGANGTEDGLYNYSLKKTGFFPRQDVSLEKGSRIDLYNMDSKDSIDQVARVLSHEYGHHFTIYYLSKNDPKFFSDWKESGFYNARQGMNYTEMSNDPNVEHRWNIAEIAAEDYVQLYGSSTGKRPTEVYDIKERLDRRTIDRQMWFSSASYNIIPQENMDIPLALQDDNIALYWKEVSGIRPDVEFYSKPDLSINKLKDLDNDYSMWELTWTKSSNTLGEEAIYYTVVAFGDEKTEFVPVKTVSRGEKRQAVIGSVVQKSGMKLNYYTDYFVSNGYSKLIVIITGRKGEAAASNIYNLDLSKGTVAAENQEERQNHYVSGEITNKKTSIAAFIAFITEIVEEIIRQFFSLVDRLFSYNIILNREDYYEH